MHHGKQPQHGHDCGRQLVEGFAPSLVSHATPALIARWLLERLALRGICRTVGVGLQGLVGFLGPGSQARPEQLNAPAVPWNGAVMRQRLAMATDAMARGVQKQGHQQWIWLAMDARSRQGIAFHVGDRSRKRAKRVWAKSPAASRQHATFSTEPSVVYAGVMPTAPHRASSKVARTTEFDPQYAQKMPRA